MLAVVLAASEEVVTLTAAPLGITVDGGLRVVGFTACLLQGMGTIQGLYSDTWSFFTHVLFRFHPKILNQAPDMIPDHIIILYFVS